jgi:hypothetical protein
MTPEIQALYPAIGRLLTSIPVVPVDGLALYAEAEDGVVSCNVFYLPVGGKSIKYRFGPPELDDMVYELWERWKEVPEDEAWRSLCFTLKGNKFAIDLTYSDRFDKTADVVGRRTSAVQAVFGKLQIDYSHAQPEA